MAIICLALFILALAGLFLPAMSHEIIAGVLFLALLWHNALSLDFYQGLAPGGKSGTPKCDKAVILLLALATVLVYVSGLALMANFFWEFEILPAFPWLNLHRAAAAAAVVLVIQHMKHEWG